MRKKRSLSKFIKDLDRLISFYVRASNNWTCERCYTTYPPRSMAIHCSHYMGRTNKATRFDLNNLDCLCCGCHRYFEDRKQTEYRDWKILKHDMNIVDDIEHKSRTTKKWSIPELKERIEHYKDKCNEYE